MQLNKSTFKETRNSFLSFIKRGFYTLGLITTAWLIFSFLGFSDVNKTNDIKSETETSKPKISPYAFSFEIPNKLNFAGDKVPIQNFDVKESLDREILAVAFWHSKTILYIKKANRYFPIIEPILKKNGIPEDFKYLAVAESGLSNAVSPAGARGVWQFMKQTARVYKLEVNKTIDERYHLEKSTEAACKYLKDAYKKYNSWALVAASYNMGMGRTSKQLANQKVNSYYDMYLNPETGKYVYRILAYKLVMKNPAKYGFYIPESHRYKSLNTYKIKTNKPIQDLASFAKKHSTNYKILKILNPWLRDKNLPNYSKKEYEIILPKDTVRSLNEK